MAYAASQPVKEVPGFARVGQAIRKGVLAALNPLFGTPENPTKLGKAMALAEEASQYGLSAGPAAAVGRVRYNPHPVRGTRIVDKRFLGDMTIPLQNRQAASSVVAAPKSMFSNSPGNMVLITEHNGQVILPREADVRLYSSERVVLPDGRKIKLEELPSIVSDLDASSMSREAKQKRVAQLNAAVTPQWMYRMYQKDMADLRATLKAHRAGNRFYDNEGIKMYDVLSRGDAASIISEPVGTRFQMRTKDLGNVTFSPNHVSDMTHDRFVKDPRLYEAYNDGFLPYQSLSFLGSPYTVRGKTVTPVLRVTDHHEMLRDATGSLLRPGTAGLSIPEYREYKRTYNVGRDIPYFGIKPVEPGGVDLMYHLDNGQNVVRANGAYSASVAVQQASKGGDSPHKNFRNFLASDKVPESIFGYRVVQRPEDYTPEDVEFFRANPKAAGFYDTGNEEMEESVPQQAAGGGVSEVHPQVPSQVRRQEVSPVYYGEREDGTFKGTGWDQLKLSDGSVATEYSVGVNLDGAEILIPSIIPGMTDAAKQELRSVIESKSKVPEVFIRHAVDHARRRLSAGLSPFKDDGLSKEDYTTLMGHQRRQFALQTGHETFPGMFWRVGEDGRTRELMMQVNDALDAWGYKRVPDSKAHGGWRQHANRIPIRFSSWAEAAEKEDAITTAATDRVLDGLRIRDSVLRDAAGRFVWDVAFVKGGPGTPALFSPQVSTSLEKRRAALVKNGVPAEIASAAALFEQAPTYQKGNKNRARHRTEALANSFMGREDLLGELAQLYWSAVRSTKSKAYKKDDQAFDAHEAGMRAVTEKLDAGIKGSPAPTLRP